MNYKMIGYVLSKVLMIEAGLMILPLLCSIIYGESVAWAFLLTMVLLNITAVIMGYKQPKNTVIYAKEGFVIVALAWVLMSAFGTIPFVVTGTIPNPIDAFFEVVSGFTTTGASILTDIEVVSKGLLFWRSFTHWIGGMGVLVFILAILPLSKNNNMHIMRAEVPGPSVGKLVPKMRDTAVILYKIYLAMTIIEIIILCICGMPLFDSILHSFGTAGTGGFGIKNSSIGYYNSPIIDVVIGTFMILFGINFNIFYYILIGKHRDAFGSEELRCYLGIILVAVVLIAINITPYYGSILEALRYAYFQVASIITTTGYSTVNYDLWPEFSKTVIILLMFTGACAGSTGGGIKIGRIITLVKQQIKEIYRMVHPRTVTALRLDGKSVDKDMLIGIQVFFVMYMFILVLGTLLISLDGYDFTTNFTAVLSCISNIGPGLNLVGPAANFSLFSDFSTFLLSFIMLAGRLELFPLLILFIPSLYKH
ncbi:MAG: TrkH family potassium uptake protein [Erysipelotrichales bacterium]|nr:TrkH family potassium uptake protein [Erysipelotrichales bacterium]